MPEKKSRKRFFVPLAAALAAGLVLRVFVFGVFRVEGRSMEPALRPGSVILVNMAAFGLRNPFADGYLLVWALPREGDVLVYRDGYDGNFKVKRCAAVASPGVYMRGDNQAESVDSLVYGSVPVESITGKMLISF